MPNDYRTYQRHWETFCRLNGWSLMVLDDNEYEGPPGVMQKPFDLTGPAADKLEKVELFLHYMSALPSLRDGSLRSVQDLHKVGCSLRALHMPSCTQWTTPC